MSTDLHGQRVLVVGRAGGIAQAVVRAAGATVIAAGRDRDTLAAAYGGDIGVDVESVDLTDEGSIAAPAERAGQVGRIGTIEEVAAPALSALTNTFLTGQVLHVDGEEVLG